MPLYAYRLKGVRGDSWRVFRVETGQLNGRLSLLKRRIPCLPLTRSGNPFLDWNQGMSLNKFLALVCRPIDEHSSFPSMKRRIGSHTKITSEVWNEHDEQQHHQQAQ